MADKSKRKQRRADYKEAKRLNKPGRAGTFAEYEQAQDEGEDEPKRERKQSAGYQPVKLPGAALLITIGLFVLWLATTGNLKRLGEAWDFVRNKTQDLPSSGAGGAAPFTGGIIDFSTYHVGSLLAQPSVSASMPGGTH